MWPPLPSANPVEKFAECDANGANGVDHLMTSVFDLPAHLVDKSDPELIAADQRLYAAKSR